jgi:ABC-type ATPase involved in cell division
MRYYHENDLRIDLDETVRCLCNASGLAHKLDQRPATLSGIDLLKAIAVREFSKMPAVMLMEFPEHFMQIQQHDAFFLYLKKIIRLGSAVVFFTKNSKLLGLANRRLLLAGGTIRTSPT